MRFTITLAALVAAAAAVPQEFSTAGPISQISDGQVQAPGTSAPVPSYSAPGSVSVPASSVVETTAVVTETPIVTVPSNGTTVLTTGAPSSTGGNGTATVTTGTPSASGSGSGTGTASAPSGSGTEAPPSNGAQAVGVSFGGLALAVAGLVLA